MLAGLGLNVPLFAFAPSVTQQGWPHCALHRFVFGTQESCAVAEWERLLGEHLGPGYVKVSGWGLC